MYDIEDIKDKFRTVIRFSQGIPQPQIDSLFSMWEKAKAPFIERFGGLIYEWSEPVEFVLDPVEKSKRALEFIDCVSTTFDNSTLADFLMLNIDTFFDNKVSKGNGKDIPEGMKLIKAFKFFESNKQALRDMQDIASQLIQENSIKGTLCFSVHPLDFLSSSENTYNWRSCHALDGEYRAGNLSYMVDESTFMVYLKGADNVVIPGFSAEVPWNSKKWRMLIHSSEDHQIMFAGRQYPFSSTSGMTTVLRIYNNLIQQTNEYPFVNYRNKFYDWRADYVDGYVPYTSKDTNDVIELEDKYVVFHNQLIALNDVMKPGYGALNYNDVLFSTCYKYPYYTTCNSRSKHSIKWLQEHPILVGGEVPCLHCAEECITNTETMRCSDCEMEYGFEENDTYGHCECCGSRIYYDDAYFVCDDYICDSCFNSQCFICDNCGEVYYNEHKHCIEISEDEVEYVCPHCYEDYRDKGDY